jgi:cytochrome c oxidase subunit 3
MAPATESIAFGSPARELEADQFGMWVFIASEALLFGAVVLAYLVSRWHFTAAFAAGSKELSFWLGTVNTAVLLTSSLIVALAAIGVERGEGPRRVRLLLLASLALGAVFLAIKFTEYHEEFSRGLVPLFGLPFRYAGPDPRGGALFFDFYFLLTGMHVIHLTAGMIAIGGIAALWTRMPAAGRRRRATAVAVYWHVVDIVWVFLYPLLYLVNR